MKPQRYLSIFFLIYSLLATSWLLASLWLHDSFTVALHDSHATFYFANLTTFTLSSILYWFLALQYHDKQKTQQHDQAQINLDRLQLALEASQEALWDWSLNAEQEVFFSAAYCANLGFTQKDFGHNQQAWQNRLLPEEREQIYRKVMRFIAEGEGHYDSTYRMLHRDNSHRWIRSRGELIRDADGQPVRFIGIARDITEQRATAERLKQAIAVFECTHEGVLITDHTNTIIHINPAFSLITGYSAEEVLGQSPRMFKSGQHAHEFYQAMWKALEEKDQWSGEIWNRRKNGEILPQYQTIRLIRDENGFISHNVAVFSDISVLKDSQSELNYLSLYDPLTGLANRSQLSDRLKVSLRTMIERQKKRYGFPHRP